MRTAVHILLGMLAGFALGILGPIGLYLLMLWEDPVNMKQGGGGPIPFLVLLAAPAGAIAGAIWGYMRAHPPAYLASKQPHALLTQFERRFGDCSLADQQKHLALMLPVWLTDYRRWMIMQMCLMAFLLLFGRKVLMQLFLVIVVISIAVKVWRMRTLLNTIRARWGDQIVEDIGPLPMSLRQYDWLPRRLGTSNGNTTTEDKQGH